MKPHLLIFHPALAPYRVDFFRLLAESFDCELVLFDHNLVNQKFDQSKLLNAIECKVSYLSGGFRYKDRYFRLGAIRKLMRVRPDVVVLSEYGLIPICIVLWRILTRGKYKLYTMTDDNVDLFRRRCHGAKSWVLALFMRCLDGFIVTSNEMAHELRKALPRDSSPDIAVVPILHDSEALLSQKAQYEAVGLKWRRENGLQEDKVVLFVGRLAPEKNLPWLIEQIHRLDMKLKLVVVGSGPDEDGIKRYIDTIDDRKIILLGRKEGLDVYSMMAMADVLILPSIYEPYGAVVGEALAIGTPCIVSDKVGAKSLIASKRQGAVYECNNTVDFQSKLLSVLSAPRGEGSLLQCDLRSAIKAFTDKIKKGC